MKKSKPAKSPCTVCERPDGLRYLLEVPGHGALQIRISTLDEQTGRVEILTSIQADA